MGPDAVRLVLLRHGQTDWNLQGRVQGHLDVELNATGRAQADAVAPGIAGFSPTQVWSSDLSRAAETARRATAGLGLEITYDPDFREFGFGAVQGMTGDEARTAYPHLPLHRDRGNLPRGVPGAEDDVDVWQRVVPAAERALAALSPGETGLIVLHGASAKLAIAGLLGWPPESAASLRVLGNCQVAVLERTCGDRHASLRAYGLDPISQV